MKKQKITLDDYDQELPATLYNRMIPEEVKKLEAMATTYPHTYRIISREFKNNRHLYDCDFHIVDACRAMMDWDLNNLHKYFKQ